MEAMRFKIPDETTGTGKVIDLGLWTNIPEEFEFTEDMFRTLRDLPGKAPDLPDDGDEDL